MNGWLPALITLVVQALIAVFVYGRLTEKVNSNVQRLNSLEAEQDSQWTDINSQGRDIAKIKGRIGLNGGHYRG